MTERMVAVAGAQLCVETFGDPADPALLLIAGSGQSMVWWEDEFCARLAAGGRYVVRYDHRDTGRSTTSPVGHPSYSATELRTDPVAVLDGLGVDRAHVAGLSMGGGLAQELALHDADRLLTVTLMSTSAIRDLGQALPPPTPALVAAWEHPEPAPEWTDRDAVVDHRVAIEVPYAGAGGLDEPRVRRLAERDVDRANDMAASLTNHDAVSDDEEVEVGLDAITVPTLVVHGTHDPLFPIEHGRALAAAIPGARLLELPGVGHQQPPPEHWDAVVTALLDHTRE